MSTVLVIDDNIDSADSLVLLLRIDGYDASAAYNAAEGIRLAEGTHPDSIIFDVDSMGDDWRFLEGHSSRLVALTTWRQPAESVRHRFLKPYDPVGVERVLRN